MKAVDATDTFFIFPTSNPGGFNLVDPCTVRREIPCSGSPLCKVQVHPSIAQQRSPSWSINRYIKESIFKSHSCSKENKNQHGISEADKLAFEQIIWEKAAGQNQICHFGQISITF